MCLMNESSGATESSYPWVIPLKAISDSSSKKEESFCRNILYGLCPPFIDVYSNKNSRVSFFCLRRSSIPEKINIFLFFIVI